MTETGGQKTDSDSGFGIYTLEVSGNINKRMKLISNHKNFWAQAYLNYNLSLPTQNWCKGEVQYKFTPVVVQIIVLTQHLQLDN